MLGENSSRSEGSSEEADARELGEDSSKLADLPSADKNNVNEPLMTSESFENSVARIAVPALSP